MIRQNVIDAVVPSPSELSICFFYLGSGPAGTIWITAM
jgi:hypothetical protein